MFGPSESLGFTAGLSGRRGGCCGRGFVLWGVFWESPVGGSPRAVEPLIATSCLALLSLIVDPVAFFLKSLAAEGGPVFPVRLVNVEPLCRKSSTKGNGEF